MTPPTDMVSLNAITTYRHPWYLNSLHDWNTWRLIWEGGDSFTNAFLEKWSTRESDTDFNRRKSITPVPGFARAALVKIRDAVFHRMGDILRRGGSKSYNKSVGGYEGGVDRRGSSMNHFMGTEVLPELLAMGRVGVYTDNIAPTGPTLADARNAKPYLYMYRVEDIMSWHESRPHQESDFQAVLLRDWYIQYHDMPFSTTLPQKMMQRFRYVWIGEDGFVWYQFFDDAGNPIDANGNPFGVPTRLELRKIPLVVFDIGRSLLNDISNHQIALLNLVSSDMAYALTANIPFYTEQQDARAFGSHLKSAVMEDGTSTTGGQRANEQVVEVGGVDGRIYDIKSERPGFIHPSSEPLKASMELQRKLEDDINKLVNLAVVALGSSRASGEARNIDNQGLEAGLAFIGLVLQTAESKLADHWAAYEGEDTANTVVVKYPERYTLKSMEERLTEAEKLTALMFSIPSTTAKKELAKDATVALMGGRIPPEQLGTINTEIDTAEYSTSNPDVVRLAKEHNLASDITLSNALGFNGKREVPKANADHMARIERISEAQSTEDESDPGARGIPDLSANKQAGKEEKAKLKDTTTNDSTQPPQRGAGKEVK